MRLGWLALLLLVATMGTVVLIDRAKRGKRLTTTKPDEGGVVRVAPAELATQASKALGGRKVDREAHALARMLSSEGSSDSALVRRYRAWIARNELRRRGGSSFEKLFTASNQAGEGGFFGTQAGRYVSTARDAYEGDLYDAERLLAEFQTGSDPTNGATRYVDKNAFGTAHTSNTYEGVKAKWEAEGFVAQEVEGDFVIFRRMA